MMMSMIEEWKTESVPHSTLITNLLVNHSVDLAEAKAKDAPSKGERLYLLGLIRLFHEDLWNAGLLFEQATLLEPKLEPAISKLLKEVTSP